MKKILTVLLAVLLLIMSGCNNNNAEPSSQEKVYTIGICNYVDDASLNQIVENIQVRLKELESANEVAVNVLYDNCNLDANLLAQIVSNFISRKVDLMVGVATPVAMNMQGQTADNAIPVVFAAVSDPVASGLVEDMKKPEANITGTSDYLNTGAVLELILALNPGIKKVGLLYDIGQDSSTGPIREAKEFFETKGITVVEKTGTNIDEIKLAAQALVSEGVEAIFTPTDNTVMAAELSIYEMFEEAGIPQYCGADSFALNGAFLGYGVDYAELGRQTADMIFEILNGKTVAEVPVRTFDNGTATINTDICQSLGLDYDSLFPLFEPFCTRIQPITTAESFSDLG